MTHMSAAGIYFINACDSDPPPPPFGSTPDDHPFKAMAFAVMGVIPTSNCTASCDTLLVLKYPASDSKVGRSNLRDSESGSAPGMGPAIEIPLVAPAHAKINNLEAQKLKA